VIAQDGAIAGNVSQAAVAFAWQPHIDQTFGATGLVLRWGVGWSGVYSGFMQTNNRTRYNLRLAERTRLAREMHDTVIQGCVGRLTLLGAAAGCAVPEAAGMMEFMNRARIQLRLTLDEAGQALLDLRHDSFDNGLGSVLEDLFSDSQPGDDRPVEVTVEGQPSPFPKASVGIWCWSRERRSETLSHTPTRQESKSVYLTPPRSYKLRFATTDAVSTELHEGY
jgi:hypothetical protein